jgi:hypothetical protein
MIEFDLYLFGHEMVQLTLGSVVSGKEDSK